MSAQASMSLGFIDSTLEQILERPGLWGPLPGVELQVLRLLEVRFVLRGGDPKDCGEITKAFLEYLSAHFPHSPPCSLWGRITAVPGLEEARHEPYFRELLSDFIAAVQRREDAIVVPTTGPRKPEYMPHNTIGRLGYLIEECAEVGHICGKILRFGFDNFHPDVPVEKRKTNTQLLLHELGNASYAIALMYQQLGSRPSVESSASDREDYDQCDARDGEHFCQLTRGHYPATKHADPSDDLKTVHEWDDAPPSAGTTEPASPAVAEVTPKPRERCPACDLAYPVVFGDRWRCEECGSFGDVVAPASDPVVLGTPTQLDRDKLRDEIARVQSVANAKSPALLDALSRAALMECERAIQQARRFWETGERTSQEGGWETFFRTIFERVLREHQSALQEVLARVVREMRTAVSIVRERTPLIKNQMEAANAVERWANEIERSLG